jgi:periplasmic divalent cation tolerance protein
MNESEPRAVQAPHDRPHGTDAAEARHDNAVILVYTTFPALGDAKSAGRDLVAGGLAACVNIFPQMTSIYVWDGKAEEADEVVMIVKTTERCRSAVLDEIQRLHPYDVPARMVIPVTGGGVDFLNWIGSQCRPGRD